jgi:hypothetical protein
LLQVLDIYSLGIAEMRQGINLHMDRQHVLPVVNEQFNDLLLNSVCDANNEWVGAE